MSPLAAGSVEKINLDELIKPASLSPRAKNKTFMLIGPTGSGKTESIKTIPEGEKAIVLDFDGKAAGLQTGEFDSKIDIVDLKFDINEQARQLAIVNNLYKVETCKELASKYQWCFVDSFTNFYGLGCQKAHHSVNGANMFKMNFDKMDYVDDFIWRHLHRWGGYFQNFVVTFHEDLRGDDVGRQRVLPLARKALSQALPKNFQEIYHASTEGLDDSITYFWRTKPEELYGNTSSVIDLPSKIPNHFGLLLGTDWGKVKDVKEAIEQYEKKTSEKITRF